MVLNLFDDGNLRLAAVLSYDISLPQKHEEDAMGMMIIRHKVRDYGLWRPIFDGHATAQEAAGLSNPRVYHSADSNKSEIVVVFDTEDTKRAKAFAASTDLEHDDGGRRRRYTDGLFPGIN
jgi:hypothetical protein